jgi:hypothetical protein
LPPSMRGALSKALEALKAEVDIGSLLRRRHRERALLPSEDAFPAMTHIMTKETAVKCDEEEDKLGTLPQSRR